jgi:hypothetical protein
MQRTFSSRHWFGAEAAALRTVGLARGEIIGMLKLLSSGVCYDIQVAGSCEPAPGIPP